MKPQYNLTNSEFAESTAPTSIAYGYDQNGNLTSKNVASNQWTYTWDVLGDLLSVANNSGVQRYYAYDGLGRRVEAKEGTSTIFYGYLGTETLAEGAISPYTDYIYPDSLRVTKVTGASGQNPTIVFYHTDALGSTRLVTDAARNVLFSDNYQPFGQDNQSTCSETYKFTGKPASTTTGLYYDYQRWYDPSIGRFISQDPSAGHLSDPQSLNRYLYVMSTPTPFTDPSGMYVENGVWHDDPGCGWFSNWAGCADNAITTTGNWYGSLSPEEQQIVGIGALAALTFATGGTDLLLVGAAGFAVGAGAYAGYTYATGGTPTWPGALEWGSTGFVLATFAYGGYRFGISALRGGDDAPEILGSQGSGGQLSRTWRFEDTTVRVNTGHGFDATEHLFQRAWLSKDSVESVIVKDVVSRERAGLIPRNPPPGFFRVSVGGATVEYRAMYVGNSLYDLAVATYYVVRLPIP